MPDFLDFMERANTGPMMTEKNFNMKILIPAIRELLKEYDITLDRENPISADDALADRLFKAALAVGFAAAGPCTRMYFQEASAILLSQVPSGYAAIQNPHPAKAVIADGVTPMEGRFAVDFAKAIHGMQAHQANELANRILAKYEDRIATAPSGKKYQECYDLKTRKPSEEYVRLYDEVREEFNQMGITFE